MKLTFEEYKPGTPERERYELGVDYFEHQQEVNPEEAFEFVERLNHERDRIYIRDPESDLLDIWKEEDGTLWVEIMGDNFWATSAVSTDSLKEIIGMVSRREPFNDYIPGTDQIWDAYSFSGE